MNFLEKWYWANYLKGTNPVTAFIRGIVFNLWIPVLASLILCFFIDTQWQHKDGMAQWSAVEYLRYWLYFWHVVFSVTWRCLYEYASYFWNHMGHISEFVHRVVFGQPDPGTYGH